MSIQESAEACADYVEKIYDSPLETFEPKLGLTEEGNRVAEQGGTFDAEEMIEWQVKPEGLGIEVYAKPELRPIIHDLLLERGIAHGTDSHGTILVPLP